MGPRSLILYHVAARSAEDRLQSGSADIQTPQHIDAIDLRRLIQDRQHTQPQPSIGHYDAVSTFHDDDFCEARLYRCSSPAVWNSLPKTVINSDSVTVFKSRLQTFLFSRTFSPFLSSTLPDLTALYKYVHYYMGILIAHRTGNFEGGHAGPV